MKRFLLFVLGATVALASCQKIDENGITPAQSSLKVTAVIADNSTKVDYTVSDDNTVTPKWAVGDEIFGYDGTGTFTFAVTAVDDNGKATFDAGSYTPADGTTLYAVYYPAKDASDFTSGELAVDLTSQAGVLDGTAPAIMCATATVEGDEVNFKFLNQTAIIGVKKFQTNPDELITTFKASGLVATGTIEVVGGELALVPDTTPSDMTISCNFEADTVGMYDTPVYFVAMPTADADINIEATSSKGTDGTYTTGTAVQASISAGNYYYMSKKLASDHVARYTNDGGTTWTYTESLAEAISGVTTTTKANGKVELLKDINQAEAVTISLKKFSFDGNGHTIKVPSISGSARTILVDSSDVSFERVTISGPGYDNKVKNRAIYVQKHSTLTLGQGCSITGFNSTNNGGAIYCTASTVNMTDDAKIENCQSVLAGTSGVTLLGGGAIFCQSASGNTSTLNMSGNASISNCKADNGGGAICLYGLNTLNISDNVLIENCEAGTSGGAINASTNINNINLRGYAHITGCKALGGSGGAICDNQTGSTMTITDNVVIDKCSATARGGAFYHAGTFTVKGNAKIEECSAKFGGGIAMWRKGTLDENMLIKGCTAGARGGAVYDSTATSGYGVLVMQGHASIDGCEAPRGGGIFTSAMTASCTVTGNASICNCIVKHTAATVYAGGAIFANSVLNISGDVLFSGNTAQTTAASPAIYGAIIQSASASGNVTISGGTFLSNSMWNSMATADAGSKLTISGGCFCNAGSGSILSFAFTNSNKAVVSGGYFNKDITASSRATLATGYQLISNPNSSEADQAASALGCTYKVVSE